MKPQTETETALAPLLLDPQGPVVVALGGGHGQAAALEAIQCYAGQISALVAVGDDGGSPGRLSGLGIPPPGDVRRRTSGHFDRLLEAVLRIAEREAANGGKFEASRTLAARYRALVLQGPESEAAAAALAADPLARP